MRLTRVWVVSALLPLACGDAAAVDEGKEAPAANPDGCRDGACQAPDEGTVALTAPQCGPDQKAFWTITNLGGTEDAPVISGYAPPGVWPDAANTVAHAFYYREVGSSTWARAAFGDSRCDTPRLFNDGDTFLLFGCAFSFPAVAGRQYELQHQVTCADGSVTLGNTDGRCMTETPSAWASGPTQTATSCAATTPFPRACLVCHSDSSRPLRSPGGPPDLGPHRLLQ